MVQKTEDELQTSVFQVNKMCSQHNFKISTRKSKIMSFKENYTVKNQVLTDGTKPQQTSYFNLCGVI
jgi:hypothetical protein